MLTIKLKPLSVNEAYKGRRFRTPKYDAFRTSIRYLLPDWYKLPPPPYFVHLEFGFSSSASDWDNCIKPLIDCIADKYGFNDKLIRRGLVDTVMVKKGEEYIRFKIETLVK